MFSVSVRAKYDLDKAMATDNVEDTLNYAAIYGIITKEMQTPSHLLEHVAGRIAKSIFETCPQVEGLDIAIHKLNPPMGADLKSASVELHLINDKTI